MPNETILFPRTGQAPLSAECEIVAKETSWLKEGFSRRHWHEITIGRAGSGRYVLGVRKLSNIPGEPLYDWAAVVDSPELVPPALNGYDPLERLRGLNRRAVDPKYEENQKKLMIEIQQGYYAAVQRALVAVGDFAEKVE